MHCDHAPLAQCKDGLLKEMEQPNLKVGRKFFLTKSAGIRREIEGLRTLPQRFAVQGMRARADDDQRFRLIATSHSN